MVLIKGAQIIDGTGKPAYKADVLLRGDKISAIGAFPNKKADVVIDGLGLFLTPGFIDVNTDSDHYLSLFTEPYQKDFVRQGVTTIFGGHCGSSLAPLLYGGLESIRKWSDINQINVDWHSVGEFLKVLDRRGLGVNFGTLIGHSTLRRALIGEGLRDLTISDLEIFKKYINDSMKEGAFGISTGLSYAHSRQVPYSEIKELVQVVAEHKGVYATHLRNEKEGLLPAIYETLKVAEETGVETLISHFKPIYGYERDYQTALEIMTLANVHYDTYPFDTSVIPIYTLLPDWAQVGGFEVIRTYLTTPGTRENVVKAISATKGDEIGDIRIAQAPGFSHLIGKTIRELAENEGLSLPETLIKMILLTNFRAVVFYKNIALSLAIAGLMREQAMVSSNGASLPDDPDILKQERFYNTFPRFLEVVNSQKPISLEKAIKKITSDAARKFGLKQRGVIQSDNFADLTMFSFTPAGKMKVEFVFVNGEMAVKEGEARSSLSGTILRHNH